MHDGHLYILETPLFRVRNKEKTIYCYSEAERDQAAFAPSGHAEAQRREITPADLVLAFEPVQRSQRSLHFITDDVPADLERLPPQPFPMRQVGESRSALDLQEG